MQVKVSVIIPVFNVKNYIEDCLESVFSQTISDIEIICIDDGSTDGSLQILEKYSDLGKIKLIKQENSGVSTARNKGIDIAEGKYLYFMDADDIITSDYIQGLYNAAIETNCKIVVNDNISIFYDDNLNNMKNLSKKSQKNGVFEVDSIFISKHKYNLMVWSKLFEADFVRNTVKYFPEHIPHDEDVYFYYVSMLNIDKIAYNNVGTYFYRKRRNSITYLLANKKEERFYKLEVFKKIKDYLESKNMLYKCELPEFLISAQYKIAIKKRNLYNNLIPILSEIKKDKKLLELNKSLKKYYRLDSYFKYRLKYLSYDIKDMYKRLYLKIFNSFFKV